MNRRQFSWIATGGLASATLVACSGEAVSDDLTPTQIPDVQGAPPTLAPQATPFESEEEESATPVDEGAAGGGAETITVTGLDTLAFDPSAFEAAPGQAILFINGGSLPHNFIVDELGIEMPALPSGEEQEVAVPEDAEVGAEYEYYCSVPGHREGGMVGTLTIVEAGAGGGEEEATPAEDEATPIEEEAAAEEEAATGGSGEAITLEAMDPYDWSMYEFEATPGQEITVVNTGFLPHNFHVDEWGIATADLNNGEEETVTVPDDAEVGATVEFYCSVPGHREAGMEGTITVV
jgi:plastocyanin